MNNFYSIARKNDNPNGAIIWSQDQIDYIIKDYQNNFSTTKLSNEFNCSNETIRVLLRKNKIKILNTSELKHLKFPRNSNFFERIDSVDKAYWLGFLYSDGYISKNGEIRINLSSIDEEHLKKFLKSIEATNSTIKQSKKIVGDKEYSLSYINIRDKKMVSDLAKLGCINNKSLVLKFPTEDQVPLDLLSHFIRGYFDGDGSLSFSQCGKSKKPNWRISFVGTKDFLLGVRKFFNKEKIALEDRETYFMFQINGNKQVKKCLDIMYKNSLEENCLTRKKEKYNHFLLQRIDCEPIDVGCE